MNGQYQRISDFFVGNVDSRGGLRLTTEDDNGVSKVLIGGGAGTTSLIRVYNAADLLTANPAPESEFDPFGGFLGGVYLG